MPSYSEQLAKAKEELERYYNDGSKIFIAKYGTLDNHKITRKKGKTILPISIPELSKHFGLGEDEFKDIAESDSIIFYSSLGRIANYENRVGAPAKTTPLTAPQLISRGAPYSDSEIAILAAYEGKGGLAKEGVAEKGILNEFYTPLSIVEAMWALVLKNGYKGGPVLEPSCGPGRFFKYLDPSVKAVGYEIDATSAAIARTLYPHVEIKEQSFESYFFTEGGRQKLQIVPEFDLVIGNPPYDVFKSHFSKAEKDRVPGATNYHDYFIARGLDVLRPGGLLCMIVPSAFMRNDNLYNQVKSYISERGELIDAYRMPNNVFPNTYVGTDILLFKRK